jgi:hypothetical protein
LIRQTKPQNINQYVPKPRQKERKRKRKKRRKEGRKKYTCLSKISKYCGYFLTLIDSQYTLTSDSLTG